jgi:formate dehydrogenase major subunit
MTARGDPMEDKAKIKLTIDGKEVVVDEGTTILEAAKAHDIRIPTLCHHPALSSWGGCRMCVVEVDGAPRLVASCVMPVREGMQVVTSNPRIIEARRTILEFLFAERNHYCMYCAQSGDCELQSLAYELQMDHLTVAPSFNRFPVDATNEYMVLDHNRCILCGRCVRACRELAGNYVLNYQGRGARSLICKDLNELTENSSCDASGVCMQVCPTGAIFSRYRMHYAVKGKDKALETKESFCPQCGLLCPTVVYVRDNNVVKIDGVLDRDRPDRGQLCRRGRFEPLKSGSGRLATPMVKGWDGRWIRAGWDMTMDLISERLSSIRKEKGGDRIFGLVSGRCSSEEMLLFRDLMIEGFDAGHLDTLEENHTGTITRAWRELQKSFLALREAPWQRIAEADLIFFAGVTALDTQPIIPSIARRGLMERGIRILTMGPTDVMSPWSTLYLPVKKGRESLILRVLLAEVMASTPGPGQGPHWKKIQQRVGEVRLPEALKKAGVDAQGMDALKEIARAWLEAKSPMVVAGDALTGMAEPEALVLLAHLALLKGLLPENTLRMVVLKPEGNTAAAMKLGICPHGNARPSPWSAGLILLDGEDAPDPGLVKRLKGVEFLAVISPYLPRGLADRAHVLIPKPSWLEQRGTYTSLEGREARLAQAVLRPPDGVRESWESLFELARRARVRLDYEGWEALREKALEEMNLGT